MLGASTYRSSPSAAWWRRRASPICCRPSPAPGRRTSRPVRCTATDRCAPLDGAARRARPGRRVHFAGERTGRRSRGARRRRRVRAHPAGRPTTATGTGSRTCSWRPWPAGCRSSARRPAGSPSWSARRQRAARRAGRRDAAIATHLAPLLDAPVLRERLAAAARRTVEEAYDVDAAAERSTGSSPARWARVRTTRGRPAPQRGPAAAPDGPAHRDGPSAAGHGCHVLDAKYEPGLRGIVLYEHAAGSSAATCWPSDAAADPGWSTGRPGGVSVFPEDADLPTLARRDGPRVARSRRSPTPSEGAVPRVTLLRYRPAKRATVRIASPRASAPLIGKVYHDPRKAQAVAQEWRPSAAAGSTLRLAPIVTYVPELALVVQQAMPGASLDELLGQRSAVRDTGDRGRPAGRVTPWPSCTTAPCRRRAPARSARSCSGFEQRARRIASVDSAKGGLLLDLAHRLLAISSGSGPAPPASSTATASPASSCWRRTAASSCSTSTTSAWASRPATWARSSPRCVSSRLRSGPSDRSPSSRPPSSPSYTGGRCPHGSGHDGAHQVAHRRRPGAQVALPGLRAASPRSDP